MQQDFAVDPNVQQMFQQGPVQAAYDNGAPVGQAAWENPRAAAKNMEGAALLQEQQKMQEECAKLALEAYNLIMAICTPEGGYTSTKWRQFEQHQLNPLNKAYKESMSTFKKAEAEYYKLVNDTVQKTIAPHVQHCIRQNFAKQ